MAAAQEQPGQMDEGGEEGRKDQGGPKDDQASSGIGTSESTHQETILKGDKFCSFNLAFGNFVIKSLPTSLCQREVIGVSPFSKGGLRGIL